MVVGKLFWKYWQDFFQSWLKLTLQFSPAKWPRKYAVCIYTLPSIPLTSNFEAQSTIHSSDKWENFKAFLSGFPFH